MFYALMFGASFLFFVFPRTPRHPARPAELRKVKEVLCQEIENSHNPLT